MVHVDFDPNQENWNYIFVDQFGNGEYFKGTRYLRGAGIGSILSSVLRLLLPVGKVVAREGLETTSRALTKMVEGTDPVEALKSESKKAVRHLVNKADAALKQHGIGRRKRAIVSKKPSRKRSAKRPRRDIFGNV